MGRILKFKNRPLADRGIPTIARIYKGEQKAGNRPGKELDYFRVEFDTSSAVFEAKALQDAFHQLYGSQPKRLDNVQFLTDNAEEAFSTVYEEWTKGGGNPVCRRRCDGETMSLHWRGDECVRTPTPCMKDCQCKPAGRLKFWLPEFTVQTGVLGQFMLITHSHTDIETILPTLDFASKTIGRLQKLAFVLYRKPTTVTTPEGLPVTKSMVYLELASAAAQAAALSAGEAVLPQLPEPAPSPQTARIELLPVVKPIEYQGVVWYGFMDKQERQHITDDHDMVSRVFADVSGWVIGETQPLDGYYLTAVSEPPQGSSRQWRITELHADLSF